VILLMPTKCAHTECKKRVPVSNMPCRCGMRFCNEHRYPETHECTYDFKKNCRGEVGKATADQLRCVASKMEKV
jgi:predicted nucleic acid binding AN1-type Zn finger protein